METDKINILRKTVMVITLILIVATAGLFLLKMQMKTVTLNYFGNVKTVYTLSSTVNSFLIENKIYMGENTNVSPNKEEAITNKMEIVLSSNNELAKFDLLEMKEEHAPTVAKIEEVIEDIPFEEQKQDNPTMNRGTTNVLQEGKEGKKSTKFLVKYNKEQEIFRAQLGTSVLQQAQNQVIEVGSKINIMSSRSAIVTSISGIPTDANFRQYNIKLPVEQQEYAYNICKNYGIEYELFLAMMYKESGYNPNALGGGNSYGLCQIHISNHSNLRAKLGISDFYNPYDNMTAGAYLLSMYLNSAKSKVSDPTSIIVYGLNSYNMGEGMYFTRCFSQGILNRGYSDAVLSIRNRLVTNGGL